MYKNTAEPTFKSAGLLACLAFMLVTSVAEARSDMNRSINLAARQWQLVEQMTNGAMLAALGIDAELNIRQVLQAHELFDNTLTGLRHGDSELGLIAAEHPEVVDQIQRVEEIWPRYGQSVLVVIEAIERSSGARDDQVRDLADRHRLMIAAVEQAIASFERYTHGGDTHSILTTTLNGSAYLRSQTQLIVGELLAIAYHDREEQNRRLLGEATREFTRTLAGLIHGDPERRLLPAANDEIRAELAKVERLWTEIEPILNRVAGGGSVDQRSITTVSRYTTRMIPPLNMTSLMYENL